MEWTKEQEEQLKKYCNHIPMKELQKILNCSLEDIAYKIIELNNNINGNLTERQKEYLNERIKNILGEKNNNISSKAVSAARCEIVKKGYYMPIIHLKSKSNNLWTDSKILFLKENYATMDTSEIAKKINKSVSAVKSKAKKLNLKKEITWTKENIDFLKENYSIMDTNEIALFINASPYAIRTKAQKLNLKKKDNRWTKEEDDYLRENYDKLNIKEIKAKLNRSISAIEKRAYCLNLKKYNYTKNINIRPNLINNNKPWSDDDELFLKESIEKGESIKDIAMALGRSEVSINLRARLIGLSFNKNGYIKCNKCGKYFPEDEFDFEDIESGKKRIVCNSCKYKIMINSEKGEK